MDVVAITKYAKLSPSKARDFARRMTGLPVSEALGVVDFSERKAAVMLRKTLRSAIANAENNAKLSADDLRVKSAIVEDGPMVGRYWARARGMVRRIQRRTCHLRVVLTDGVEEEAEQDS